MKDIRKGLEGVPRIHKGSRRGPVVVGHRGSEGSLRRKDASSAPRERLVEPLAESREPWR
jgi:hypothetical protein